VTESETRLFQVRLSESEKRRVKALAAGQGLNLRQATVQAFEAWAEKLQAQALPAERAPGQPGRAATSRRDRRSVEAAPSSTSGGRQAPTQESPSRAWLRRAAQSDWAKCPAVEGAPGERGRIWVVRGTGAPLSEILTAVAEGHPFLDIAEAFEINPQQLIAVLQFATEGAPRS